MTTIPDDMVERVARAICKSKTGEGVHCCQWPGNGGRAMCFAAMGNFDDGARAAIEAMQPAILAERERVATHLFDREAFMMAVSGDGDPYVKVQFKTLKEMQSFHRELCKLAAIMSQS